MFVVVLYNILLAVIFVIAGLFLYKLPPQKPNSLYGYRSPRSRKNQTNWDAAQLYSSKKMMQLGLFFLVLAPFAFFVKTENENALGAYILGITALMIIGIVVMIFKTEKHLKKLDS